MINHSDYSCDKCAREASLLCKNCLRTADKPPTRFKRKKKTGCETPEFRKPTPPPPKPEINEFKNYTNFIIRPKRDKLDAWKNAEFIPYKDEILVGYNDIKVIYKLGDGVHQWNDLPESTLEEVVAFGYIYCNTQVRSKVKLELIPTRTMR